MIFSAQIKVMPLSNLLDPQGKAVLGGLTSLGIAGIDDVRVGKNIVLQLQADNAQDATDKANKAATLLLANAVMEMYEIDITAV